MTPEKLLLVTKESPTVGFHRFSLLCSKERLGDLFCFFEGVDDPKYYSPRIPIYTKRKCQPIICGNKKAVVEIQQMLKGKSEYQQYKKAYFVDRDFDPPLENKDIYETPCYSFENLYVHCDCLSEILKTQFLLPENDSKYEDIRVLFEDELKKFSQVTLLFNAWYAALKQKKLERNLPSTNVNLEEKFPKEFISLSIGFIESGYDLEKITTLFPNAISISEKEIDQKMKELEVGFISDKLRGKYQFQFFDRFIRYIIESSNGKTQPLLSKKPKFNVDKNTIYTMFSSYARTPGCLIAYLSNFTE